MLISWTFFEGFSRHFFTCLTSCTLHNSMKLYDTKKEIHQNSAEIVISRVLSFEHHTRPATTPLLWVKNDVGNSIITKHFWLEMILCIHNSTRHSASLKNLVNVRMRAKIENRVCVYVRLSSRKNLLSEWKFIKMKWAGINRWWGWLKIHVTRVPYANKYPILIQMVSNVNFALYCVNLWVSTNFTWKMFIFPIRNCLQYCGNHHHRYQPSSE